MPKSLSEEATGFTKWKSSIDTRSRNGRGLKYCYQGMTDKDGNPYGKGIWIYPTFTCVTLCYSNHAFGNMGQTR